MYYVVLMVRKSDPFFPLEINSTSEDRCVSLVKLCGVSSPITNGHLYSLLIHLSKSWQGHPQFKVSYIR